MRRGVILLVAALCWLLPTGSCLCGEGPVEAPQNQTNAVLAGKATPGIVLVSPREGSVVPIISESQKAFVRMAPADRDVLIENIERRKAVLHAAGCRPQPVTLAWSCAKPGCDGLKYAVEVKRMPDGKTVLARTTGRTELAVDNLEVATRYRWTVTAETRSGQPLKGVGMFQTEDGVPRLVRINGVPNVRDLGGRIGLNGRRVRQGLVFRSAGLNTNACKCYSREEIMKMYKAGTLLSAVPERSRPEAQKVREAIASNRIGRATFNHLVKEWTPGKPRMKAADIREALATFGFRTDIDLRTDRECYGMAESPLGPSVNWVHVSSCAYSELLTDAGRDAFARVLRVFLDERNYPIDFHCIAGADRTGTVAYVLGALLGYSEADLLLDWELTAFCSSSSDFKRKTRYDKLVAAFAEFPGTCARERVEGFVLSLGFSDADISRFRGIMLE